MNSMDLSELEEQFGETFVQAFRSVIDTGDDPNTVEQFQVGEAKDNFSEILNKASTGSAQVVRKRTAPGVVMLSFEALAKFAQQASSKRRFAEMIAPDPSLPMGVPDLSINEAAEGHDDVSLGSLNMKKDSPSAKHKSSTK